MSKNTEISRLLQGVTVTGPINAPAYRADTSGTAAAPVYTFGTDPDTGIFLGGTNTIGFTAGTLQTAYINTTGLTVAGAINVSSGAAASPTYHFNGHTDLGFFYAGGDAIGIGCNGLKVAEFLPTGMFSNGYAGYTVSYSPTTAQTIDFSKYRNAHVTLGGSPCVFTFTAPAAGSMVLIKLIQDATGSRLVTWPGTVDWPGGTAPVLSTAANAVDIVSLYYDGTAYFGAVSLAFA